jgi:hypothetical protein
MLDWAMQTCPSQHSSPRPPHRSQRALARSHAAPAPQVAPQQISPRPPQRSHVRAGQPHAVPLGQSFTPSQQVSPSAPHGAQTSPAPQPIPGSAQTAGVPGWPAQHVWPEAPHATHLLPVDSNWHFAPDAVQAPEQHACPIPPHVPHDPD